MKILVTVKRVLDPYAKVKPLADGTGLDDAGVKFEINPFDEIAVEEAVRLKEKHGDVEVVVVSIGKSECEDQLRKALAIGADRAILLENDAHLDSLGVAKVLQGIVASENPDLVLMGKQATDNDCGQVGPMLAGLLGWPQASFASKIDRSGNTFTVERETDLGIEVVEMDTPCLITTDLRLNEPRYIALPGIIKARSKPLDRQSASGVDESRAKTTRYSAPPARSGGKKVTSVEELVAEIKAKGALGA